MIDSVTRLSFEKPGALLMAHTHLNRRAFVGLSTCLLLNRMRWSSAAEPIARERAQIAITMDLEMSREYPRRGMQEWDYEKGNLDEPTKKYAVEVARLVASY